MLIEKSMALLLAKEHKQCIFRKICSSKISANNRNHVNARMGNTIGCDPSHGFGLLD